MKSIYFILFISSLFCQQILAQNIPNANIEGPYGLEVNSYNGNLYFERTGLLIPNTGLSIELSFTYNSLRDSIQDGYGKGFSFNYNMSYALDSTGVNYLVQHADGRVDLFEFSDGAYLAPQGIFDRWTEYEMGKFLLETKYGMRYYFEDATHQKLTKIEDTNENIIELNYNVEGFPIQIKDPSNRTVSLNWANNLLQNIEDNNFSGSRAMSFEYDSDGHLTVFTDPVGETTKYAYEDDALIEILNERDDYVKIDYDEMGRVKVLETCVSKLRLRYNTDQYRSYAIETNSNGDRVNTFAYDEEGKLISKISSCCGFKTAYGYDEDNNAKEITNANGYKFSSNHDEKGNTLFTTDPQSNAQAFQFNDLNRLTSFTNKNGHTTSFSYDEKGSLELLEQALNVSLSFTYDDKGNMLSETDGAGNTTNMEYSPNNDIVQITYAEAGTKEIFEYDGAGNMTKSEDGAGNATYYEYDALNRLRKIKDDLNNELSFSYDQASNLTLEKDANGNEKEFQYDPAHRLEKVKTAIGETTYRYDESDNLIAIIDANGHETSFKHNARNLVVEERDALGKTSYFAYDGNGNLISKTDANGDVSTYQYDALNRLVEKAYKGNKDNYYYDAVGNLIYCANNEIAMNFSYDALNRLTSKTIINWNKTIAYEYDKAGNRTKMIDETGETIYSYDQNNRLVTITNPKNETTSFVYDLAGRLTEQHQGNGASCFYTYDLANRLLSLENKKSDGTILSSFLYEYDNNGNRTQLTREDGRIWEYSYDEENRLTSVKENGLTTQAYSFDPVGNRIQLNGDVYAYDEADRVESISNGASYQFDDNGNMIEKTLNGETTSFEYDGENRLIKVLKADGAIIEFRYDPFGNRISKTIDGDVTNFVLDGENILMELNANNTIAARYTAGLSLDSWISVERNDASYFYHSDGLGSVFNLTNSNSEPENTYEYDAYGNLTNQTGSIENPFTYTGREWDASIGTYYYRKRFYDAELGRFLTKDLFMGNIYIPSGFNYYAYVRNNPIIRLDPSGLSDTYTSAFFRWGKKQLKRKIRKELFNWAKDILIKPYHCARNSFNIQPKGTPKDLSAGNFKDEDEVTWKKEPMGKNIFHQDYSNGFWGTIGGELVNKIFPDPTRVPTRIKYVSINGDGSSHEAIWDTVENRWLDYSDPGGPSFNYYHPAEGNYWSSILHGLADIGPYALGIECDEGGKGNQDDDDDESDDDSDTGSPPGAGGGGVEIPIVGSLDPNEIIAPVGYDIQKWVAKEEVLPYTILFENDPEFATAAAQRVVIEHKFDSDLNRFSFRLGDFGFGDYYFSVPEDVSYYNTQIDLSDSLGVLLQVTAGLNAADSSAFWIFESKDPLTGLAANLDASAGFLPVNDTLTRVGEGFVNFTIQASNAATTGTVINAQAKIIFDDNAAIETNVDFNTVDADAPISKIHTADENNGIHTLAWSGTDVVNGLSGSGLANYTLYRSINNSPFLPIAANLTDTTYTYEGIADSTYCFFVRSVDFVGNKEALKAACEPNCMNIAIVELVPASGGQANGSIEVEVTGHVGELNYQWSHDNSINSNIANGLAAGDYSLTVSDAAGCVLVSNFTIDNLDNVREEQTLFLYRLYPVPTDSKLMIEFSARSRVVFIEVYDMLGKKLKQQTIETIPQQLQQVELDVANFPSGNYLVRILERDREVSGVFAKQ